MKNLPFLDFEEELKREFERREVDAKLCFIPKRNGTEKRAFKLTLTKEKNEICPVIYTEDAYDLHIFREKEVTDIVDEFLYHLFYEQEFEFKPEDFTMYGNVRERIIPELLNAEWNEGADRTLMKFGEDFLLGFRYILPDSSCEGVASIAITDDHLGIWGVDKERVFEDALDNIDHLESMTPKRISMNEFIKRAFEITEDDEDEEFEFDSPMQIITNGTKCNGAYVILSTKFRNELRECMGEDFYLLPSSIHEWIAIPQSICQDIEFLEEMIRDVNKTKVSKEERLGEHVYAWGDGKLKRIAC